MKDDFEDSSSQDEAGSGMKKDSEGERTQKTYLLAFESTHVSMAAQKALVDIDPHVIPTPKAISENCGMALRFKADDDKQARDAAQRIPHAQGLYSLYVIEGDPATYRLM